MAKHSFPTGMSAVRYRLSPLRRFNSKGLREGVFGGNRAWLIAFLTFRGLLAVKHALSKNDERVAIDVLKPGERILIRTIPVSNGKERKRLLRGG